MKPIEMIMNVANLFRLVCLSVLALGLSACVTGKDKWSHTERIEWLNVPSQDSTMEYPNSPEYYEAEYVGHDGVYLTRHYTVEHVGNLSDWNLYEVSKKRYVVLNPEREVLTTFRVPLFPRFQILDSVYLTITSPDGVTKRFGMQDLLEDSIDVNRKAYKFVYPDVKKGSMIEEGYVLRSTDERGFFVQNHSYLVKSYLPTEELTYKYTYPTRWDVYIKRISEEKPASEQNVKEDTEVSEKEVIEELADSDASGSLLEKYSEAKKAREQQRLQDSLAKAEPAQGDAEEAESELTDADKSDTVEVDQADVLLKRMRNMSALAGPLVDYVYIDSTYDSDAAAKTLLLTASNLPDWKEEPWSPYKLEAIPYLKYMVSAARSNRFVYKHPNRWFKLFKGLRLEMDEIWDMRKNDDLKELTQEIIEGAETNVEKAEAITAWVHANLEVGECRKCDYKKVMRMGVGSNEMLLEITIALLRNAGFDSQMIMIHPADKGYFDINYRVSSELLGAGVVALKDADTLVLYPQIKNLPAGLLPPAWQNRPSIYLDANDATIGRSPGSAVLENTREQEFELTINDDGLINVREINYYRGLSGYSMRDRLDDTKAGDFDELVENLISYDEGDVTLSDYKIENRDERLKPLIITTDYTIDNLVTVTPDEVIFQTGGLFSPSTERKQKLEEDERENPIRIYADELLVKRIILNFPSRWNLDTKLKAVDFGNVFGKLEAKYDFRPGQVEVQHLRLLKKAKAPKQHFGDLLKIVGPKSQLHVPTLVFTVN